MPSTTYGAIVIPSVILELALALAGPARAQSVIMGVVREDSTRRPIESVEIVIDSTKRATRTDSAGRFSVTADAGVHVAAFRRLGYRPERMRVTTTGNDTVFLEAVMVRDAAELQAVEVKREPVRRTLREQFYDRQKLGLGKFMDTAEVRRAEGRPTADVLRSLGVDIIRWDNPECRPPFCDYELRAVDRNTLDLCAVSVLYDGVAIYRSGSPGRPPDFKKEFAINTLSRIEFYRRTAIIPQEFMAYGTRCGLLLLWSRRG